MSHRDSLEPQDWIVEIERGLEYRKRYGLESDWADLEKMYYNVHPANANAGPNLLASVGDALLSSLSVPEPYIMVKARRPDAVEGARVLESVDNMLRADMEAGQETETSILHAFLFGRGIGKIGFDSEFGWNPELDVAGEQALGISLSQVDRRGRLIEFGPISPGMPWARAVLPADIVVPWGTRELEDAQWIAHRVVRHIDDVKRDAKYSHTRNLIPNMSMVDFTQSYESVVKPFRAGTTMFERPTFESTPGSRDAEFVELWEIHDKRTSRIKVVVAGHDEFIRNEHNALQLDGHLPFVSFAFTPRARTFWVTPDAYYLQWHQLEESDIAVQAAKQRRASVLKLLVAHGAISEEERTKLNSQEVGAMVEVEGGFDLSKVVLPLQAGNNQNLYLDDSFVRNNAREQLGISRNQAGEFAGRRTSASEATIVDRASQLRMSRRGARVAKFYQQMFEMVNRIIFRYWNTPRVVDVLGEDGQIHWFQFTGPQLKGSYRYEVKMSDSSELQSRRAEAIQLYAMLSQDPTVDPVELRKLLIDAFNDPEFARVFKPEIQGGNQQGGSMSQMSGGITGAQMGGQQMPQLPGGATG